MTISLSDALIHRILETGDTRVSPRSEIGADVLAWLQPLIADALRTGECLLLLDSGWWMRCTTEGERLSAFLWLSRNTGESRLPVIPRNGAAPHVTLTVTPEVVGEERPILEVSAAGIAALSDAELVDQALTEAGELERCIAWAWLIALEL